MWHPPTRAVARLAVAAALVPTAAAAALAATPSAAAAPVYEPPGKVTWGPGCPNPNPGGWAGWDTHLAWSGAYGDYLGPDGDGLDGFYEGNCNGSSRYILDQATQTALFRWHLDVIDLIFKGVFSGVHGTCHIWAYIPSQFAGDRNARYDFWADDTAGHLRWLGWPGHTIDQETTSGWVDLGSVDVSSTDLLTVTLTNQDSVIPGWYAGAGDLSASCQ